MKKQILALSLIQGLALQPVMAENLNQYREGLLKGLNTNQQMSEQRLQTLRAALGTQNTHDIVAEDSAVPNSNAKHQLYSSIIMKNTLQNGVEEIMQSRKYNARIPLDPTWTPEEHKQILALEDRKLCVRAIMNSRRDANGKPDGINQIVKELFSKAVSAANSGKNNGGLANNDSRAGNLITSQLESGPNNKDGVSLLGALGRVNQTEIVDGLVHRVTFEKNGESLPLSLSTMLTFRVGEDDAFVQTQDCLLDYLKDQREVFKARLEQKESSSLSQLFTSAYNKLMALWNQVEQSKYNVATSSDEQAKAQAEIREMHQMIQTTDPTAQLLAKLKFFSEGRNKTGKEESEFMNERLQFADVIIPFLEVRAAQAHKTNAALKQLSPAQVNYLTDMFLQLRGKDLPTMQDMASMGEVFAQAAHSAQDQQALDRLSADFMYYQVIGKQLTSLENRLAQERDEAAAKQKDLEQIRN